MKIKLRPVGVVRNDINTRSYFPAEKVQSQVVIDAAYSRGLDGIEEFSHIIVVFWMDKIPRAGRNILKVHPRHILDLPLTGVFATRSPSRPNPIGITTVKLVRRQDNVLTVTGLDALDGTPVLDIKPYLPEKHDAGEIKVAEWVNKARQQPT